MKEFYDLKQEIRATINNWITLLRTGLIITLIIIAYNTVNPYEKAEGIVISETHDSYFIDSNGYSLQSIKKNKIDDELFTNQKVSAYYNKKNMVLMKIKVK